MKISIGKFLDATAFTDRWAISSRRGREVLGWINWYPRWKQYVFEPASATVYSQDCLADLAKFVKELNEKKEARNK